MSSALLICEGSAGCAPLAAGAVRSPLADVAGALVAGGLDAGCAPGGGSTLAVSVGAALD